LKIYLILLSLISSYINQAGGLYGRSWPRLWVQTECSEVFTHDSTETNLGQIIRCLLLDGKWKKFNLLIVTGLLTFCLRMEMRNEIRENNKRGLLFDFNYLKDFSLWIILFMIIWRKAFALSCKRSNSSLIFIFERLFWYLS